jgi:anaphase-promoting complex subunit 3
LIVLGAAEEATAVFGEAAAFCIQKQYLPHGLASQSLNMPNEDRSSVSARNFGPGPDDASPRQFKNMQGNNLRDIPGNYHGAAAVQPSNGGSSNISSYNTPSPMVSQVSYFKLHLIMLYHK